MLKDMRYLYAIAFAIGVPVAWAADRPVPVVVELFTSEGCSSCPAADRMLSRLEQTQPVPGAQVVAIEEHIDYWNQLGWTDPFSSPQYRARQNDYAVAFKASDIYTPQMVVNGQSAFVGNDMNRAYHEIGAAAQTATTLVDVEANPNSRDPDLLDLSVQVTNPKTVKWRDSNVYLAVTERGLMMFVQRGENSGRTLRHSSVVRSFGVIGRINPQGANGGQLVSTLRLPHEWRRENLRAVVFVQERGTFRITGAGVVELR
jgi:hypothetical protein